MCNCKKRNEINKRLQSVWAKHVWWTREVILAIIHDTPGLDIRVNKLLQNPAEMSAIFAPFYPPSVIAQMTSLFKTHLSQGGDIVTAAKAGDTAKVAELTKQWYANSDEIARLYASINPYYDQETVRQMMYTHLGLTIQEATYELQGKYQDSINTFDKIQDEAAMMADYFADGLAKQFFGC